MPIITYELNSKHIVIEQIDLYFPSPQLSTDNGAMIAAATIRRAKEHALLNISEVKPWMPLAP